MLHPLINCQASNAAATRKPKRIVRLVRANIRKTKKTCFAAALYTAGAPGWSAIMSVLAGFGGGAGRGGTRGAVTKPRECQEAHPKCT